MMPTNPRRGFRGAALLAGTCLLFGVLWVVAACDTADIGTCGSLGRLVEPPTGGRFCVYGRPPAGGRQDCPVITPYRVEVAGGIVCSDHPIEPGELPADVCVVATSCDPYVPDAANLDAGTAADAGSEPADTSPDADSDAGGSATEDGGSDAASDDAGGASCTTDTDCGGGRRCCDGTCRNTLADVESCGSCSVLCSNAHGTTTCSAGQCQPICAPVGAWGECDFNRVTGCETDLHTLSSCGSCGFPCALPNASESCATGSCRIEACNAGYSHCDSSHANGCEVGHAAATSVCSAVVDLGARDGDSACGVGCLSSPWEMTPIQRQGRSSALLRATVREASSCVARLEHRVELEVPAGIDYDLLVYRACGAMPIAESRNAAGMAETVVVGGDDAEMTDSSFGYWIEVRYASGASCEQWTLRVFGHDC